MHRVKTAGLLLYSEHENRIQPGIEHNRPLSRRLDRCDRVIQDESGDSNGGNV